QFALWTQELLVATRAAGERDAVLVTLTWMHLEGGQRFAALLHFGRIEVGLLIDDDQLPGLPGARNLDVHLQQASDVIGEAHIHRYVARALRRHRNLDLAQGDVVLDLPRLALVDLKHHLPLVVVHGRELLDATGRHHGVAFDDGRENTVGDAVVGA